MIKVTKTSPDRLYVAEVSPPHGPLWTTDGPTPGSVLIYALESLGVHQVDLMDALDEADREWVRVHGSDPKSD